MNKKNKHVSGKNCFWKEIILEKFFVECARFMNLTFILARNVSILVRAVWKTSEGRSYQTLRQRRTWALPSLIPAEMPAPATPTGHGLLTSAVRRLSSWCSSGWTSMTTYKWTQSVQIVSFIISIKFNAEYFNFHEIKWIDIKLGLEQTQETGSRDGF